MREIFVYLSHCCLLFRKEFVKTNSFLFAFLNVFTSLAVDYYGTLVKNVFYSVLPSLTSKTCFFDATDGTYRKQLHGFLLRKKLPKRCVSNISRVRRTHITPRKRHITCRRHISRTRRVHSSSFPVSRLQ